MRWQVEGWDLSVTGTGWACDDVTVTLTIKSTGDERLQEFYNWGRLPWPTDVERLVVLEDVPPVRGQAIKLLSMISAAFRLGCMASGTPYLLVSPGTLKRYAAGNGHASKSDMRMALYKRTGLDIGDDNQVDAWWLRAIGCQLLGEPIVDMPKTHLAALDKLKLPIPAVSLPQAVTDG